MPAWASGEFDIYVIEYYAVRLREGRNDRVAEGARLESAYTPKGYRGFESRFLRSSSGPFFREGGRSFLIAVRPDRPARKGRAFI